MNKYKCIYNWHGEIYEFFTTSKDKKQAKSNSLAKLHNAVGQPIWLLMKHYASMGQFSIEEINGE